MTEVTTVPFSKLVDCNGINARAATKDGLDELAASIAAKGLIQPLAVRPADGGRFEVIDGRRRFAAMGRLVKAKTWKRDTGVPVLVRNEDDREALETSLMANTVRLPMHPVDQHEVFARLAGQGAGVEEIAARFGLADKTVRQQLALGRLAPEVREAWRKGRIDVKAAQAFTLHADHAVQAAALKRLGKNVTEWGVRSELAADRPKADRVPPAVLERYRARGGQVTEDLFEGHGYVEDGALLKTVQDEVTAETVAALRTTLEAEGWSWVAVADDLPRDWKWTWVRVAEPEPVYTPEQQARLDVLHKAESATMAEQDAADAEIESIEALAARAAFTAEQKARSGCVIDIGWNGEAQVAAGIERPDGAGATGDDSPDAQWASDGDEQEDDDSTDLDDLPSASTIVGAPDASEDDEASIPATLAESVEIARSVAAANVIETEPLLALRVLIAQLRYRAGDSAVRIMINGHPDVDNHGSAHGRPFAEYLADAMQIEASAEALAKVLAPLVSSTIDLVETRARMSRNLTAPSAARGLINMLPAQRYLAEAHDSFNAADYFGRATKAVALEALAEIQEAGLGAGMAPEDVLAGMKKAELAALTVEHVQRTGWLPRPMRHPMYALIGADEAPMPGVTRTEAA